MLLRARVGLLIFMSIFLIAALISAGYTTNAIFHNQNILILLVRCLLYKDLFTFFGFLMSM